MCIPAASLNPAGAGSVPLRVMATCISEGKENSFGGDPFSQSGPVIAFTWAITAFVKLPVYLGVLSNATISTGRNAVPFRFRLPPVELMIRDFLLLVIVIDST